MKLKPGDDIVYIGKGFLGFNPEINFAKFIKYDGMHDAIIEYEGREILVYIHEIEAKSC